MPILGAMRTLAALVVVLCTAALVRADKAAVDEAAVLVLRPKLTHVYVTTETVSIDTALRFEIPRADGGFDSVSGSATDKNVYSIRREPLLVDADGNLLKQRVEFTAHTLTQSRLKPGDVAAEQTFHGDGPLKDTVYEEERKGEHFQRRVTRQPTTSFGANPLELRQELDVHNKAAHPLLPAAPVAIGDSWKPDTAELSRQLLRFGRKGKLEPELAAVCTLESCDESTARLKATVEVKNLLPLDSLNGAEWREGTVLKLSMEATITIDLKGQFVRSVESTIVAKVEGELFRDGQWLSTVATTTHRTVSETQCNPKPDDKPGDPG